MKILMVTSELAPLAKTGGLADAVAGLARGLSASGHEVLVLLPRYAHLPPAAATIKKRSAAGVRFLEVKGSSPSYRVVLLAASEFRDSGVYLGDSRDAQRFLALGKAALALPDALKFDPDVIHCHDWHAALVPAMVKARAESVPTVLTLHNLGYQGVFALADLPGEPLLEQLADGDSVNFLASGIRHADAITTVSPTYATEILTHEFGMGLEEELGERSSDLIGILNGVDYDVWSPEVDPYIKHGYSADDLKPKERLKRKLQKKLGFEKDRTGPLMGVVSRLTPQKGIDLLVAALPALLADTNAAFVILGSGDAALVTELGSAASAAPDRVAFVEGYNERLAHRIFAGADFILVPSRYEPCGLTQLYALRYGSIPVVRKTGGLADSIAHFDPATGTGTGCVFEHADAPGLIWAVTTAARWYDDAACFSMLRANAMAADFSWASRVPEYESLYARVIAA